MHTRAHTRIYSHMHTCTHTRIHAHTHSPSHTLPVSDSESSSEEGWEDYCLKQTKWFNEKTREEKTNIKLWLDYVAFHDKVTKSDVNRRPVIEKKISIFEEALKANPHSEELLIGYLFCGEQIWEYP